MRRFIMILFLVYTWGILPGFCGIFAGGVTKDGVTDTNKIIDSKTRAPISQAKITLPQNNYKTYSDREGRFDLDADIKGDTILSVEKAGYKPYSLTVNQALAAKPMVLGIEKSTPKDITLETDMFHLGDNNFSDLSANSKEFKVKAIGPYYSKNFKLSSVVSGANAYLVIGSIIGVDTQMARSMGQNKVSKAFASPPEVYFNGNKIAEIELNGDGQKIKIPNNLLRPNQMNEVTIKTGRNMMQTAYVDYDDIEFMNLSLETK